MGWDSKASYPPDAVEKVPVRATRSPGVGLGGGAARDSMAPRAVPRMGRRSLHRPP